MPKLSRFSLKILRKLQLEPDVVQLDDSWYQIGRIKVPASLLNELNRWDLISTHPDKLFCLTEPGAAYLRRAKVAGEKRASGVTVDGNSARNTAYSTQHQRLIARRIVVNGRNETHQVNIGDTAVGWLAGRKDQDGNPYIEPEMLEAALRFQKDYELAGLGSIATSDPAGIPPSGQPRIPGESHPSDSLLDARKRVRSVTGKLGPVLSDLLIRTCCFGDGLEQVETANAWPRRSGKLVLRIALERLVDHYDGHSARL